jgi:predicted dehydrogenase
MTTPTQGSSRRAFLGRTSAAAGLALAGGLNMARVAHAAGGDTIKIALIGAGGRGTGAASDCLSVDKNVKLVAVADAFADRANGALGHLKKQHEAQVEVPPERVFSGLNSFQQAIDCGIDMVVTAAPPGFRPAHFMAAIKAGKHVFMEKPCCTDAPGYRTLIAACKLADEKGLKVGVGLQRRHESGYLAGVQQIQEGKIGDVLFLRCYWNGGDIWLRGRNPGMSEMQFQVHNWYHFVWTGGDNIAEQHVHNIDVCNWIMNDHPIEANGMGGCQVRQRRKESQIFDHHFVEFTYKNGVKMFSQCRQQPNTFSNVSEHVHGTKGSSGPTAGGGPKLQHGPYQQEHLELLTAIRNNTKYNEGWYGATSSFTAVLGRMATYSGQVVKWDDAEKNGPDEQPERLAWDAMPRAVPNADGVYPMPIPGVTKPY